MTRTIEMKAPCAVVTSKANVVVVVVSSSSRNNRSNSNRKKINSSNTFPCFYSGSFILFFCLLSLLTSNLLFLSVADAFSLKSANPHFRSEFGSSLTPTSCTEMKMIATTTTTTSTDTETILVPVDAENEKENKKSNMISDNKNDGNDNNNNNNNNNANTNQYWKIAPGMIYPEPRPLPPKLQKAMETNTHPEETQDELGRGIFILADWRENWNTYESPPDDDPDLIDPNTGYAEYELVDIEGNLPDDLEGVLYRNGPGKFGVGNERVQHVLDADALVYKIVIPPPSSPTTTTTTTTAKRKIMFQSRFVETNQFKEEQKAGRFLYRGTFGTGPSANFESRPQNGLNSDPIEPSKLSKLFGSAFNLNIKNAANTQVISFGGKLLALFEAGLPHALDPETLQVIGEDDLGGVLKKGLPVKLGSGIPKEFEPDLIGGTAHTAHPNMCPKTGNMVGWHWSQLATSKSMEISFTEWSAKDFKPIKSSTFELPGCELAPHDMALTENSIIMTINAMKMNQVPFLLGLKGPAASLSMDGRAPVKAWIFPRPTAKKQFQPFSVEVPPCFSIHFSHGYEDSESGNIITFFSGWPPSDAKDFLGAWGGFAPDFPRIPPTFLWRLEIDPVKKETVSLDIAPGCANVCVEHVLVHPNFNIRKAQNVYGTASNLIGDSTAPNGYVRLQVESGSTMMLTEGEFNNEVDAYWFGTRYFVTEPIIVPKKGGNPENEKEAYLLGMVRDAAKRKNFLSIFDLEKDLKEGPICKIWLKSGVPHGVHGCFSEDGKGGTSVFC